MATHELRAVQHIRRLRGGSQAQLFQTTDGYHVVKFSNNPQHKRVLANEYICCRLARLVGLPVPSVAPIHLSEWLISNTPDLRMQLAGELVAPVAGHHLAISYCMEPFDYLPERLLDEKLRTDARRAFAGILAFDKWVCNADSRQAIFLRAKHARSYTARFIDFGHAFNHGEWSFPDSPLRGVYAWNVVYSQVRGWRDFEPWLWNIEHISREALEIAAAGMPPDWYDHDTDALRRLLCDLYQRRTRVRELLEGFRNSNRRPFPEWAQKKSAALEAANCG